MAHTFSSHHLFSVSSKVALLHTPLRKLKNQDVVKLLHLVVVVAVVMILMPVV
jgi:hypothetical protein